MNEPSERREILKSFLFTGLGVLVVLAVLIIGALMMRKYLLPDWDDYTSVAALIVGVGGVFAFVGLGSDTVQESANATGLGAIGFGGIMLALKEVVQSFSEEASWEDLGTQLFLKSIGWVFLMLVILVGVGVLVSLREHPLRGIPRVAYTIGISIVVVGVLIMWLTPGGFKTLGWALLVPGAVTLVYAVRHHWLNSRGRMRFDPLHELPPLPRDPCTNAPKAERLMAYLTYLGAVARVNAEEGRGADAREIRRYAKKAGYEKVAAIQSWDSKKQESRFIELVDGRRYLNAQGHEHLRKLAQNLNIEILGDITPLALPPPLNTTPKERRAN